MSDYKPTTPEKEITAQALGAAVVGFSVGLAQWAGAPPAPPGLEAGAAVIAGAVVGWVRKKIREEDWKQHGTPDTTLHAERIDAVGESGEAGPD